MQHQSFYMESDVKLTQSQFLQLIDWLRQLQAEIMAEQPTLDTLAKRAHKELGFYIKGNSLGRHCKTAGIVWQPKRKTGGGKGQNAARSERRLIATKIDLVANSMIQLADAVDFKFPPEVRAMLLIPSRSAE